MDMPKYVKHLQEVVVGKKRHVEFKKVVLTEECNLRVSSKLPKNLKYPRIFTLPIQNCEDLMEHYLCDLVEIINLMPLSLF